MSTEAVTAQTRYAPLPIVARHKQSGEVCRVYYVLRGDNYCAEGDLVLEHVNGDDVRWELFSTPHCPAFHSREWKMEFIYEEQSQ